MPSVNFYLKKPESSGKSLIFLQFKYSGYRLVYSFGQVISPKDWNPAKQRLKSNKATTTDGEHSLNDLLDNLENVCKTAYFRELKNSTPPPEILKQALEAFMNKAKNEKEATLHDSSLLTLLNRFINGEIKNKGKDKSENTLQNYRTFKGHLEAYSKHVLKRISFEDINLDFFYRFCSFLKRDLKKPDGTKGLKHNTIAKDITILKTIMGEAVDMGYTTNMQFRHKKFSITEEDADSVYLTEKEIISLYNFNLSADSKLIAPRDLFIVGCFTGLRYSDYSNISPENIVENEGDLFIKMITQKTKELVIIPCNPIILSIFKKYETNANRLPHAISSQKFNEYIKKAAELAGLTETGRLSTEPGKALWECISSHTARRSFATNLYLEGFPAHELMKITGHRTEASFRKYIKVTKLETAKRLSDHIKKNWSSKLLKVAS